MILICLCMLNQVLKKKKIIQVEMNNPFYCIMYFLGSVNQYFPNINMQTICIRFSQ